MVSWTRLYLGKCPIDNHLVPLPMPLYRLGDNDDDVRSVAASYLLPITIQFVEQLPEEIPRVLAVLWSCLSGMRDDLSSSVGAVMDLLGKLVSYNQVTAILANSETSYVLFETSSKILD